jgi:hypothetical protein
MGCTVFLKFYKLAPYTYRSDNMPGEVEGNWIDISNQNNMPPIPLKGEYIGCRIVDRSRKKERRQK